MSKIFPPFDFLIKGKSILSKDVLGPDFQELIVSESIHRLDSVSIRFTWSESCQKQLKDIDCPGESYEVQLNEENTKGEWKKVRTIEGDLMEMHLEKRRLNGDVTFVGLGLMNRLKRNWQSKVYESMKQNAVVSKVAKGSGMKAQAEGTAGSAQDYVQANQSDANFLQSIVASNPGYVIRFEKGKKLRFVRADSAGDGESLELEYRSISRIQLRHSLNDVVSEVEAMGYDPVKGEAVKGKAKPGDVEGISGGKKASELAKKFKLSGKLTLDNLSTVQATQCKEIAKAELQRRADRFVKGTIECAYSPTARSGGALKITGKDVPWPFDKVKYRLSEVTHHFRATGGPSTTLEFYSDSLPK